LARYYRLPLRLITQGKWLRITHGAKAVLPVLGMHADDNGVCWPGVKLIQELTDLYHRDTIREATRSLISLDLIEKVRQGRRNVYYLKPPAITVGKSYYPMSEEFIKTHWKSLSYVEKAVFGVLAVKAAIEDPDWPDVPEGINLPPWAERLELGDDEDVFGHGEIQKKKWIRLAGVSFPSWNTAIEGLVNKDQIVLSGENDYIIRK